MDHLFSFSEFLTEAKHSYRGKGGKFAPKPLPDIMAPRGGETVPFTKTKGVKPVRPQRTKRRPAGPTAPAVKMAAPGEGIQKELPLKDTNPEEQEPGERQRDLFKKPGKETPKTVWDDVLQRASENKELGRELLTLLGAMYQVKRRNPAAQLTEPKLITNMKNKTFRDQMQRLFDISKNDDMAHLAARSKQLSQVRSVGSKINIQGGSTKADNNMLQQMYQFIKRSSPETLKKAKEQIDRELRARAPEPELPPKEQEKKAVIGMP